MVVVFSSVRLVVLMNSYENLLVSVLVVEVLFVVSVVVCSLVIVLRIVSFMVFLICWFVLIRLFVRFVFFLVMLLIVSWVVVMMVLFSLILMRMVGFSSWVRNVVLDGVVVSYSRLMVRMRSDLIRMGWVLRCVMRVGVLLVISISILVRGSCVSLVVSVL